MFSRNTSDYSPTRPGSKAENQAINARREMLKHLSERRVPHIPKRKTWAERMERKARGFVPR